MLNRELKRLQQEFRRYERAKHKQIKSSYGGGGLPFVVAPHPHNEYPPDDLSMSPAENVATWAGVDT